MADMKKDIGMAMVGSGEKVVAHGQGWDAGDISRAYAEIAYKSEKSILANPNSAASHSVYRDITRDIQQMCRGYVDLLSKTGFSKTGKEMTASDMIDASSLFDQFCEEADGPSSSFPIPFRLYGNVTMKNGSCVATKENAVLGGPAISLLPCFEEGTLKVNKFRYISWKINRLNIRDGGIDAQIDLWDYKRLKGYWEVVAKVETEISDFFEPTLDIPAVVSSIRKTIADESGCGDVREESYLEKPYIKTQAWYGVNDILMRIPNCANILGWGDKEKFLWKEVILKNVSENTLERQKTHAGIVVILFFDTISFINKTLENNKAVKKKGVSCANGIGTAVKGKSVADVGSEQPKKLVRTVSVGGREIEFTTEKPPRAPSESMIRHYSVASWKRRATMRTYKSGKKVYIREQVCHRKALKTETENIPQSVIKINKKENAKKED